MQSPELDELIRERRALADAHIAHAERCATCRAASDERLAGGGVCAEFDRLSRERERVRQAVRAAARDGGWRSPTEYERATYGRVGAIK
jgi:hypothetical protein